MSAQQVYAVIKARSKYNYQQPREDKRSVPFPVTFVSDVGGHCVRGNDNSYRLEDLNFFVRIGAEDAPFSFMRIK